MKRLTLIVFVAGSLLSSVGLRAEEAPVAVASKSKGLYSDVDLARSFPFSTRVGIGSTVGPSTFLLLADFEYHVDRYLAVGPMLQLGMGSSESIVIPSFLKGRLKIPVYPLKRLELSLQTGFGLTFRSVSGIDSMSATYTFGGDLDYFLNDQLSVGAGAIVNVTGSFAERTIGSFYASAKYQL